MLPHVGATTVIQIELKTMTTAANSHRYTTHRLPFFLHFIYICVYCCVHKCLFTIFYMVRGLGVALARYCLRFSEWY